jgi:hypothetical protein
MRNFIVRAALLCACLPLASCADDLLPDTFDCPDILIPAIVVDVRNGVTGAALSGASLEIRDGATVATGGGANAPSSIGAGNAAGTYDVRVSRAGYLDWTHDDVQVAWASEECGHPRTVNLTANLAPAP